MTREEKQAELLRHRALLLATLDYLLEHHTGGIVFDGWDPAKEHFSQQKLQTEKYFKLRRLDRLQQRLANLTERFRFDSHLQFTGYIKGKTGYDLDLFGEVRNRVEGIIAKRGIQTEAEGSDVGQLLKYYQDSGTDPEKVTLLMCLFEDFYQPTNPLLSRKRKNEYTEVIKRVVTDDIEEVTIRISTGPRPKHFEEQETVSPDGKRKVIVTQWSDGKQGSTYVTIHFETGNGTVYSTTGIHPDVKAYWKDNQTVVIEAKKEYPPGTRYTKVQSFQDIVTIEYMDR